MQSSLVLNYMSLRVFPQVHQWRFRNNGAVFREEDWNRLKKIGTRVPYMAYASILTSSAAEGNPDEQKIGAFGVGKQRRVIIEYA